MRGSLKTWLIMGLLLSTIGYALAEDITLTTYYPSPRGVYKELQVGSLTLFPPGNLQVAGSLAVGPGVSPGSPGEAFVGKLAVGATAIPNGTTLLVDGDIKTTGNIVVDLTKGILTEQGTGLKARPTGSGEEALWLQSMGDTRVFITPTGVGIGAQEPISALHIQDGQIVLNAHDASDELVIQEAVTGNPDTQIRMIYQGAGGAGPPQAVFSMAVDGTNGGRFAIRDRKGVVAADRLVINSAGNIGMGTGTPQSPSPTNNVATGNLDANDVYLRSKGKWASQVGSPGKLSCVTVGGIYAGVKEFSCPVDYSLVSATCHSGTDVVIYHQTPWLGTPNNWLIEPNTVHCGSFGGSNNAALRCCIIQ